ncbi:DUF1566 domain-containing protein [Thalassomonas sp. M1454]|uniref:Lcl C-terminal domain-containing protein n=1 Tax=Thalassomonas sp. M1454 TaxID=2594477 RepID=UPI0011801E8D|nr:DUF1566 domain-containing protein [Thalassomonas sp. M1454]TRX53465.1 DUF1566 domain-containing protein [Thalassomonas sp. M1454]
MNRITLLSLFSLSLAACGGGGGGGSEPETTTTPPTPNVAPIVTLAEMSAVKEQTMVQLSADASDSDGSISSYAWKQLSGPTVSINNASSAQASFMSPTLVEAAELAFEVTVTDNDGDTAKDSVTVNVLPVNTGPTVALGDDVEVNEQTAVSIDAMAEDSDGTIATYKWTQTAGTDVSFSADVKTLAFESPMLITEEELTFSVEVTDNEGATASDDISVSVLPVNALPVVNAGAAQTINEETLVDLAATATDTDGTVTNIAWTQTGGATVELSATDDLTVSFTSPTLIEEDVLTFSIEATDNEGGITSSSVSITVQPVNIDPVAVVGNSTTTNPDVEFTIDGSASTDVDGSIASYSWTQVSGTSVELTNAETAMASFTAPTAIEGETLTFQLMVTDNEGASHANNLNVYVNEHPVARATNPVLVKVGDDVILTGVNSSDDGQIVEYSWTQVTAFDIELDSDEAMSATFVADVTDDEEVVFELTVTDDMGLTDTTEAKVTLLHVDRFIHDSGVNFSAGFLSGNDDSCISDEGLKHDCELGRDAEAAAGTLTKVGAGDAGFDFTKLDAEGNKLADSAESWSCVLDNFTGAIWEVKTTDGGVRDRYNGYRWGGKGAQGYNDESKIGTYSGEWDELVDELNTNQVCGKTNWRLPTVEELGGLLHYGTSVPYIDMTYFPNAPIGSTGGIFWTGTPALGRTDHAWAVDFNTSGQLGHLSRTVIARVRLISNNELADSYVIDETPTSRYLSPTEGVIADLKTGLMWSRCVYGQEWSIEEQTCTGDAIKLTWENALKQPALTLNTGYEGWRLPNIKELRTIANTGQAQPSFNTDVFFNIPSENTDYFWSSTPVQYLSSTLYSWVMNRSGGAQKHTRTSTVYVILVRDID